MNANLKLVIIGMVTVAIFGGIVKSEDESIKNSAVILLLATMAFYFIKNLFYKTVIIVFLIYGLKLMIQKDETGKIAVEQIGAEDLVMGRFVILALVSVYAYYKLNIRKIVGQVVNTLVTVAFLCVSIETLRQMVANRTVKDVSEFTAKQDL
ncbi:hypothetical protein O0L34_g17735 [Tuta absoluta]|nr:hypothetical protein O0L34_g17735 [Tuta absoluta]